MKHRALICILAMATSPAFAQVAVHDPWVRATVSQQKTTGAFMRLSSPKDTRLVSASSPVEGVTELHEMAMEKDVMKMRAVPAIEIPAGTTIRRQHLVMKRPETGIPAADVDTVIGRRTTRVIRADHPLQWRDLTR